MMVAPWLSCEKPSSTSWICVSTSGSTASSIRPCDDAQIRCTPSLTMLSATAMATKGSSHSQPVKCTSPIPNTTPADVQTSVSKWRASPSSAIERCTLAERNMTQASNPLSTELATDSAKPSPTCSSGCGENKRCPADQKMPSAATRIRMPSKPEEKYSALWCP